MNSYVDLGRFIVAGHSNGGMNATDIIINRPSEIKGIIYMASYPNPGIFGFGAQNVSSYNGKVLLLNGDEDDTSAPIVGTTNAVALTAYQTRFSAVSCKSRVLFAGIGHGGFGDYSNPAQPVGTIGRNKATASIRHYIVSFLNSQFKYNQTSFNNFNSITLRPTSVSEFENTCSNVTSENEIELNNSNELTVFPVPAKNNITLNFNNVQTGKVLIYNSIGKLMFFGNTISNSEVKINTESFTSGIYIICFEGEDGSKLTQKFIIAN
jgi:hypothetical protein